MEKRPVIHLIDSSERARAEDARLLIDLGYHAEVYASLDEFIAHAPDAGIVILRDSAEPGAIAVMLSAIAAAGIWLPVIVAGEHAQVGRVVASIKAGAFDFLEWPLDRKAVGALLGGLGEDAREFAMARRRMIEARKRLGVLSPREREVLDWLADGNSNKAIARGLSISPRTVEIHRANMMTKLGAAHAAEAVRLRFEADSR